MLPKPLFNRAKAGIQKRAKEYLDDVKGKTGLAAIPIDISKSITKSDLEFYAKELGLRIRISDQDVFEFLENMVKAGILTSHPLGGYMANPLGNSPVRA